ncbi:MAG: oxygenase MpaB family protein [Actinomycetota bacterium]
MTAELKWQPDLDDRGLTLRRIDSVAFTPMPDRLRNELITRAYGDISDAMANVLGQRNATWATFGQWASNRIGHFINLPFGLGPLLIGRAFADGNRDVYADIGRALTIFLDTVGVADKAGLDLETAWLQCEGRLKERGPMPPSDPGVAYDPFSVIDDPRRTTSDEEFNKLIVEGMHCYRLSLDADDDEARDAYILIGNCLLAIHEQRVLSKAITIGFRNWLRTALHPSRIRQPPWEWRTASPGRRRLAIENAWIRLSTYFFIGMKMPRKSISAGRQRPQGDDPIHVDWKPSDDWPNQDPSTGQTSGANSSNPEHPELDISDPHQALKRLFAHYDANGERARCWNDLKDRVGYILSLFAETQRNVNWFNANGTSARPQRRRGFASDLQAACERVDEASPAAWLPKTPRATLAELNWLRTLSSRPEGIDPVNRKAFVTPGASVPVRSAFETDTGDRGLAAAQAGLLDDATVTRARQFFVKWSPVIFLALMCRSLPDAYAAARGARLLGLASDLGQGAFHRSSATASFVMDMLEPHEPHAPEQMMTATVTNEQRDAVAHIRYAHATVSDRITARGQWNEVHFGQPINQEDVLGTALSFCIPVLDFMTEHGIEIDEADRAAYTRFWMGVGHMMGAPLNSMTQPTADGSRKPQTYRHYQWMAELLRHRHHYRTKDGVRLMEALHDGIGDGFPMAFRWLAAGLIETMADPRVASLLLVPITWRGRRTRGLTRVVSKLLDWRITRPVALVAVRWVGERWLKPFATFSYRDRNPETLRHKASAEKRLNTDPENECWPLGCGDRCIEQPDSVTFVGV